MTSEQLTAQQALDLAEIERDRYREMRRKVLEEAVLACAAESAKWDVEQRWAATACIKAIGALATSDPPEPQFWRDTLGPEDRYEKERL